MIALGNLGASEMLGVRRKLNGERRALSNLTGCPVDFIEQHGGRLILHRDGSDTTYQLRRQMDHYHSSVASVVEKHITARDYRLVYIRYPGFCDLALLRMLRHLRHSTIVMEVPTYPFNDERTVIWKTLVKSRRLFRLFQLIIQILFDQLTRTRLRKYVDRLVCIGNPPEMLWGIATARMSNGSDMAEDPLPKYTAQPCTMRMICVASLQDSHGVDRLIRGMAEYISQNPTPKLHLDVVGYGAVISSLQRMTSAHGLQDSIAFHGFKSGSELRDLYESSDIGIGSLALHRVGRESSSVLKVCEYCVLGLPFVYAYHDFGFSEDLPFCLRLPASDDPINISDVIAFWRSLDALDDVRRVTRAYAEQHLSWEAVLAPALGSLLTPIRLSSDRTYGTQSPDSPDVV